MRKAFFLNILTLLLFITIFTTFVEARSGCCSWHGGVCGCGCCDGTPLSSTCAPYYPECSRGNNFNLPIIPTIPSCPLMSSYDSLSGSCKCFSGYVASGNECISKDQACINKYGYNSKYDILKDGCICRYGYVWNSSGTSCINGDQSCWNKYGIHSAFDSLNNTCKCSYGYLFNDSGSSCISEDNYCQDKFGFGSKYNSLYERCECKSGYRLQNSRCVLNIRVEENNIEFTNSIIPTVIILPSKTPTPILTSIPTITPRLTTTPTLTISPTESPTLIPLTKPAVKGIFSSQSVISFWKWILSLFSK